MKLAAIYNVWDGCELLQGSINCIKDHVDIIIIVYQDISNFGEVYDPLPEIIRVRDMFPKNQFVIYKFTPNRIGGSINETEKRNIGIVHARQFNCTHFLHMDCDEYYQDFGEVKKLYTEAGSDGSVCEILTYFKKPTLRLENKDNYFVPFIHKLSSNTTAGNKSYPFYCDPTRRINTNDVKLLPVFMHHFSWIRTDIKRKINNSSARNNILKTHILEDYNNSEVREGFFVRNYNQILIQVENIFQI